MRADVQVISRTNKMKKVITVFGLLILAFVGFEVFRQVFWPLAVVGLVLIIAKLASTAADRAKEKDNPEPMVYNLSSVAVFAQIEKAVETIPPRLQGVSALIDYPQHTPVAGEPLHLQASFVLDHPELYEMRDVLDPKDRSLKSKLYLYAYIKPLGNRSKVTLRWLASPITTRTKHDDVIDVMTAAIDGLVASAAEAKYYSLKK